MGHDELFVQRVSSGKSPKNLRSQRSPLSLLGIEYFEPCAPVWRISGFTCFSISAALQKLWCNIVRNKPFLGEACFIACGCVTKIFGYSGMSGARALDMKVFQ